MAQLSPKKMPFFFIVPIWFFFALSGIVLLFLRQHRRMGLYSIVVSTTATLTSFLGSTAVLYIGARIGPRLHFKWFGIAVIGVYLLMIGLGAAIGGIAGFFLTRYMVARFARG